MPCRGHLVMPCEGWRATPDFLILTYILTVFLIEHLSFTPCLITNQTLWGAATTEINESPGVKEGFSDILEILHPRPRRTRVPPPPPRGPLGLPLAPSPPQ